MVEKIKTGTTCIGLVFKDGVILAADRKTTAGNMIVRLDSEKVHILAKNVVSTHAGMVSDAQVFSRLIESEIKLMEMKKERLILVKEAAMIANNFQYKHIRTPTTMEPIVGYLIGGVDKLGAQLFEVGPDGTLMEFKDFAVDGSGSIFIKGVLQDLYKKDMSEKDALALVEKAFNVSFRNDTASGGGFIAKVVTKDGITEVMRKVVKTEFVDEK